MAIKPVDIKFPGAPTYVDGPRVGQTAVSDPWVKVGTTTIDGTLIEIAGIIDASAWPIDWDRDAKAAIDLFLAAEEPWNIGGRLLRAVRSHIDSHDGTALIGCDIVRRQSDLDAERLIAEMTTCAEHKDMVAKSFAKPCPECGPHGNRGEVLLAASWARCTTCNGGKSGDLWGEVSPTCSSGMCTGREMDGWCPPRSRSALSSSLLAEGASDEVARVGVQAFIKALGNTYDDSSIAKASQVIEESLAAYRLLVPEPIKIRITVS